MKKVFNIVILGPQGSGKGTQAGFISKKFRIPTISTGDIFRENIRRKTLLGKKAERLINNGKLVPDSITNDLIKKRLVKKDAKKGWILDGFPRNLSQARFLDKLSPPSLVIEVYVNDNEVVKRFGGRRTCSKCGTVYHLAYNPPKKKDLCNKCGGRLIVRDDDKQVAIKKRLKTYHEKTEPLIEYYQKKGIVRKINGKPPIKEVSKAIGRLLRQL